MKLAAFTKLCSSFEASYKLNSADSSALGADQVGCFRYARELPRRKYSQMS